MDFFLGVFFYSSVYLLTFDKWEIEFEATERKKNIETSKKYMEKSFV